MIGHTCPRCAGPLARLGVLGRLLHLRCINCGAQYSKPLSASAAPGKKVVR